MTRAASARRARGASTLSWLALGLVAAAGCSKGEAPAGGTAPSGQASAAPAAAPGDEGAVGAVEGWVRLAEGSELPRLPPPEQAFPAGCPPYRAETDAYPVRLVGDRRLTDVLVNVTDYERGVPERPRVRKLAIGEDCRLTPRLLSATRGDTLELTNRTSRPFFPSLEALPFTQALLDGESQTFQLGRGGFRRAGCSLAEPCGVAWVVTLYHPLHDVTDDAGHFRVEGVPAGEEVSVSAFHPLFPEPAVAQVTVPAGETLRLELTLRSRRPAAEGAPPAAADEAPASGDGDGPTAPTD